MSEFFMFGKYSSDAVKAISAARTEHAKRVIEQLGGQVKAIYALLGQYDLVLIVQLPTMTDAMRAALQLGRLTGISFSTAAAMPVEEFDDLVSNMN